MLFYNFSLFALLLLCPKNDQKRGSKGNKDINNKLKKCNLFESKVIKRLAWLTSEAVQLIKVKSNQTTQSLGALF